jgi:hypothetical protein
MEKKQTSKQKNSLSFKRVEVPNAVPAYEYFDGSGWQTLASQSYVDSKTIVGTVSSITAGTGLSGGTITTSGTIAIADVGITPTSYNWPTSLNINSKGQVIGASAGTQPFTTLIAGTGIGISSGGGSAQINLNNTGISSGTYSWPSSVSVNSQGQLTNIITSTSGSLPINLLQNYPGSINTFLRGDGTWTLPFINNLLINGTVSLSTYGLTTSGNVSVLTGTLIGNNLAAYNSGSINVLNPLNLPTALATAEITIQNSNASSFASGLKCINTNTGNNVQFGFNNSTNEGYMWSGSNSAIKFGTNNVKWMEILSTGLMNFYNLATFQTTTTNNAAQFLSVNGTTQNAALNIVPYTSYMSFDLPPYIRPTQYVHGNANSTCLVAPNNTSGGSAIAMNGSFIQLMQNFNDLGVIFSDTDFNTSTNWQSYISASGNLIVSSAQDRKYSVRPKPLKDYLERLKKLKVYSYGLKTPIETCDDEETKRRKYIKNKTLQLGLLAEEVQEIFDNCTNIDKDILIDDSNREDFLALTQGYEPELRRLEKPTKSIGIDYNRLMCYLILSIQELDKKVMSIQEKM